MRRTTCGLILCLTLVLAACGGSTSPDSTPTQPGDLAVESATTPAVAPDPTPTTGPAPDPLDILQRSGVAMADAAPFRVESARWPAIPGQEASGLVVREYLDAEVRYATSGSAEASCGTSELWEPPFTRREEGALVFYRGQRGATGPEVIELLDARSVGGPDAWVVRYRFTWPSVEDPVPVERTEWIARETYLLLRVEEEQFDPWGWVGQEVLTFSYDVASDEACSLVPLLARDDLQPLTGRRLEDPSASRDD